MSIETALLAGGCFWGMQDLLRRYPGVISTRVGYTGGDVPNATYRNHGTHAEANRLAMIGEKNSPALIVLAGPGPQASQIVVRQSAQKLLMPPCVHIGGEDRRVVELRQSFLRSTSLEETGIACPDSGAFSIHGNSGNRKTRFS
jgi:Peptide methionine sulfoxide reductase